MYQEALEKNEQVFSGCGTSRGTSTRFKSHQTVNQLLLLLVAPKDKTKLGRSNWFCCLPHTMGRLTKFILVKLREQQQIMLRNTLLRLQTISLRWQNITKVTGTSRIRTPSKFYAEKIICYLAKYEGPRGGGGLLKFELGTDVRPEVLTTPGVFTLKKGTGTCGP